MNTEFLALALFMALLAALLVAIPLWRQRRSDANGRGKYSIIGALAVLVVLPLGALSLYTQVTSYPWDNPERLTAARSGPGGVTAADISTMVSQLADRMAKQPTVEGLTMLGRSYVNLQRFEEAVQAYHRAWEMTEGKEPTVSLGYAEALLLADRKTIMTSAGDLLDGVLAQLPDNPKALWYGGMSAVARGQSDLAQQRLAKLLTQPNLPDQLRQIAQQQLAALSGNSNASSAQAPEPAKAAGPVISINVDIDAALAAQVTPQAVLYVFARDASRPGPPAAVKRIANPRFPLRVQLSDRDAMMAAGGLAKVQQLQLTARLSASGEPVASAGDLYGDATPDWQAQSLETAITINSVVE